MTMYDERPRYPWVMPKLTSNPLYYNGMPMMSYNAMLNLLYGGRGVGKSFWFKVWTLLVATGETVWMRRYDNEIRDSKTAMAVLKYKDLLNLGKLDEKKI